MLPSLSFATDQLLSTHPSLRCARKASEIDQILASILGTSRARSRSGPLAPQARNITYLQTTFAENRRLTAAKFGRQSPKCGVWTPPGLRTRRQYPCSYARLSSICLDVGRRQQIVPIYRMP